MNRGKTPRLDAPPVKAHRFHRSVRVIPLLLLVSGLCFIPLSAEQCYVAAPAIVLLNTALIFVVALWDLDNAFPLLELGAFTVSISFLYSFVPLVQFLASGMAWTPFTDYRLLQYSPGPAEFGGFAWYHVGYLVSFAVSYLAVRGRAPQIARSDLRLPDNRKVLAMVFLFAAIGIWTLVLRFVYGVDFTLVYHENYEVFADAVAQIPFFIWQLSAQLGSIKFALEIFLVMALLGHYRSKFWRGILFAWIGLDAAFLLIGMGARTSFFQLLIAVFLLYHRIVKPLRPIAIVIVSSVLLSAIMIYGFVRDEQGTRADSPIGAEKFSASNEFLGLYATAYDVHRRREAGLLSNVPWQLYINDVALMIPSQLLPFEKVDPTVWYLDELGLRDSGIGFMWGVVAQAGVGFGLPELIVRGLILGVIFGFLHRWYVRRSASWIVTGFYVFMCLVSYYTFRANTFYVLVYIEYGFFGALLLLYGLASVLPIRTQHLRHPPSSVQTASASSR